MHRCLASVLVLPLVVACASDPEGTGGSAAGGAGGTATTGPSSSTNGGAGGAGGVGGFYEGSFADGSPATIHGAGFGERPSFSGSGPYLHRAYDDCSEDDPLTTWDEVAPGSGEYAMRCRTPDEVTSLKTAGPAVPTPHAHASRYLSSGTWSPTGDAWMALLTVYGTEVSQDFYASFYYRGDPDWVQDPGTDGNHKMYSYGVGDGPYPEEGYFYFGFDGYQDPAGQIGIGPNYFTGPALFSPCDGANQPLDLRCVDQTLVNWYVMHPCGNNNGDSCTLFPKLYHPVHPRTDWIHIEYVFRHADAVAGFHEIRIDNIRYWYAELNDDRKTAATTGRSETLGGYRRDYGSDDSYRNNFSYFSDVYLDLSWARVVLANAATYDAATVVEVQPVRSWSDGAIAIDVRLGRLASGSEAWVYVLDATNAIVGDGPLGSVTLP
jgi:hypothetical protein